MTTKSIIWKSHPGYTNLTLEGDGFSISYNRTAGAEHGAETPVSIFVQTIGGLITGEGDPQEETALYDGKTWRILKGDFRKEYEAAWPDWDKSLAVYRSHLDKRSAWSTDDEVAE